MCKILLVEDDIEISIMLQNFLKTEHFDVIPAYDGESACKQFESSSFSLVLLDLMLPKRNGIEVMSRIRAHSTVPIIILSAKDTDSDKTLGLGLGADDYITKPFSVTEVLARIKANIRRSTKYAQSSQSLSNISNIVSVSNTIGEVRNDLAVSSQPILKKGSLTLNPNEYSVTKNGQNIPLTSKEFDILKLFMQNPKKVYTKEQIYSLIWNDAYLGDENAVNVHISRLRGKIEDNPREPKFILTVWGIGYKFAIDFSLESSSFYLQLVLKSVVIVSMSFIALFVGMKAQSSKATIVTSFLLIFLTQANVGEFTMANNAAFPVILTLISFGFAVLSVCNVEKKDLM